MSETKPYKLYASYDKKIPDGVEYSLQPFGANYLLCFTDKELPQSFKEIPPETPLTAQEQAWLTGCKLSVNAKFMKENESEVADGFDLLLTAVEKELNAEKKKLSKKGGKKNDA